MGRKNSPKNHHFGREDFWGGGPILYISPFTNFLSRAATTTLPSPDFLLFAIKFLHELVGLKNLKIAKIVG